MKMTADDRMELWTVILQVVVLTIGFSLIFSWGADLEAKGLAVINLVLLALIYAMPDRIKNSLQKEIRELHKSHGVTQTMIMELREVIPDKVDFDKLPSDEQLERAQGMATRLENVRSEFGKSFDRGFQDERSVGGGDRVQFFADVLGTTVYLSALVGTSALLGWLLASFL